MYRFLIEELYKWKNTKDRKPLILMGARQVGKTWLMKEFGNKYYKDTLYINFEKETSLKNVFDSELVPEKIIHRLENILNVRITEETLIIFDEIQEVPKALTSLKYFCEEAPEYDIVCAGSFLGIGLHENVSFPVGKVDILRLYPLNFKEFLMATEKENLVRVLENRDFNDICFYDEYYKEAMREYFIVGGMPECVNKYTETGNFYAVRDIQEKILDTYENDFSKHAPLNTVPKIRDVWHSVPNQLAKENKKFQYSVIKTGGRKNEYANALLWLLDCGFIHQIFRIKAVRIPLEPYKDRNVFKIYLSDIGLLGCLSKTPVEVFLNDNPLYIEFKGTMAEQFVCQEIISNTKTDIAYYTNSNSTMEIDFICQKNSHLIPVEVKSGKNTKSVSLKNFAEENSLGLSLRLSLNKYTVNDRITDLPLYCACEIEEFFK